LDELPQGGRRSEVYQWGLLVMSDAKFALRIAGIILLVIFALIVGIPLALTAAGVTLWIVGVLFGLAVAVIKVAVVLAVVYLVLVGIRTALK
jgi:hypothetical protein